MAGISDNLEEFRELSRKHYKNLIEGLKDKYCWKCPMRTNSSEAFCREVDSWIRLSVAFEMGIYDHMRDMGMPNNCLEVIASKILEKKMNSNYLSPKFQKLIILKIEENMEHGINSGDFLLVNETPKTVKKGDIVLLPRACPLSLIWFSKTNYINKMPLKVFKIVKVHQKAGVKYITTDNDLEIPIEYVYGLIIKVINNKDPIFTELHLKDI
ncbi:S24/S26 family peptidase [Methanobacterium spitsbergense]|uniref:S24/S26 family peptidase n=1 Tax=Methanobacterium spitsbergense TaxID=2874285 RepID=A0A8T5UV27_9EURY|nr:S24/S26 family peptidase [Methanobacterium spitsbergense]MBZ2165040.1 S24/S26 family peptidase [Methanobacterium spitsbergense]